MRLPGRAVFSRIALHPLARELKHCHKVVKVKFNPPQGKEFRPEKEKKTIAATNELRLHVIAFSPENEVVSGDIQGYSVMPFLVDPAAATPPPSSLSTTLDIIDKVVKVAAVFIAAAWGYLNYRRGRTFKRRLEPKISGKIFLSNGTWILTGVAQLKNVGLSVVTIEQKGTAIVIDDLLVVTDAGKPARIASDNVAVLEVFKSHGWIEPGEPIEQSFLITLPERANRVGARMRLGIVSHGIEWNDDTVAEVVQPGATEKPSPAAAFTLVEPAKSG